MHGKNQVRVVDFDHYYDFERDGLGYFNDRMDDAQRAGAIKYRERRDENDYDPDCFLNLGKYDAFLLSRLESLEVQAKEASSIDKIWEYKAFAGSTFSDRISFLDGTTGWSERINKTEPPNSDFSEQAEGYRMGLYYFDSFLYHFKHSKNLLFSLRNKSNLPPGSITK